MKALVIGGTGVIGTGIVKQFFARGAEVTSFDRHRRPGLVPPELKRIRGDRTKFRAFERTFESSRYDVVVDLVCFTPEEAESTCRTFGGRCGHLQFCSTVCVYGTKIPPTVLVDEQFPAEPETPYGRAKLACERIFERAARERSFALTVFRPSNTYGPGGPIIDQLEIDGVAWDRVVRGLPVFCAGDGLGLWQPTHRDDCGKLFAYAALNPRTYGETYNATGDAVCTWREYYRRAARALDTRAKLIFVPATWLTFAPGDRFSFLREISQFHGAYSSAKAKSHVPEFRATIDFETGARATFADLRRRGAWRSSESDPDYQRLVDRALAQGFRVVEA